MKKILFFGTILALLGLLLTTTQALAGGPPAFVEGRKNPALTPIPPVTGQGNPAGSQGNADPQGMPGSQGSANSQGKRVNYRGTITAVSASSLTISLEDGSSKTFILNSDTHIKVPTLGRSATAANLKTGMQVNVNATQAEGGQLTARIVLVVPGKPALIHRVGMVIAYTPGASLTIQARDGGTTTFLITADTKILPAERASQLAVGVRVTVIAPRDVTGGALTAAGIVVNPS